MKYDLVKSGMLSEEMSSFIVDSLKEGVSVLVSGQASSGKSMFIDYATSIVKESIYDILLTENEDIISNNVTSYKCPADLYGINYFIDTIEQSSVELLALDIDLFPVLHRVPFLKSKNQNVISISNSATTYAADEYLSNAYKSIGLSSVRKEDDFRIIVQLGVSVEGRRIVKEISERIPLDTKGSYIVPLFGYNDESKCFKQLKYTGDGSSMLSKLKEGDRFIYE